MTNARVATYFLTLFNVQGQKLGAQVLSAALATYVTSSNLAGGSYAASYGFSVTTSGTGAGTYNVGSNGAAFGVPNNTVASVLGLLQQTSLRAVNGVLWGGNSALSNEGNAVFDGINQAGDIV
jgi:hypothetical protein